VRSYSVPLSLLSLRSRDTLVLRAVAEGGGGGTAGDPVAQEVADAAARARVEVKGPQVGGRT
jgi:hypothetical protein